MKSPFSQVLGKNSYSFEEKISPNHPNQEKVRFLPTFRTKMRKKNSFSRLFFLPLFLLLSGRFYSLLVTGHFSIFSP